MENISDMKTAPKTARNNQTKSSLMLDINLPINSFSLIISKNPNIVNSIDNQGETLLSYAIKHKKTDICQIILQSKILDLNYQDKNGNSYLHLAVLYKLEKLAQTLIKKGINVNKQNKSGNTCLHLAFLNNFYSIIPFLKNNKADVTIRNKNNQIPEELKRSKISEQICTNSRGQTSKSSKSKYKENNRSNLTAKATNTNIKKNMKSIKEAQNDSKNIKVDTEGKNNIKKIDSLPTLREMQKNQKNDKKTNKNLTALYFIQQTDIGKKTKHKKMLKDNSNDKQQREENTINKKKIKLDLGNNTSTETKFKSGTNKDKMSKTNNIEEQDKLNENQNMNFNKEDDIFDFPDCGEFEKQYGFSPDINNDFNKYPLFHLNKGKDFREEEVNIKEAYERINKKYIDEVIKNSKNNNEKDSDENDNEKNSQIKEDDEYCIRFEDSDSSDEENNDKNKSLFNISENSLLLIKTNKNSDYQKTRNNNNEEQINLGNGTDRGNYFLNIMNENQFSKTLVKKPNNKKLNKLSDKFLDDNNNEFDNQMTYQLYLDKGQKYSQHLQDLLNNNLEKNEIKEKYTQKSADIKEPTLLPEIDQNPNNIQELEDVDKNILLKEFLLQINMQKYINNFIESGFDDIKIIIEQAQKGIFIKDSELKEAGILVSGDRAKLLIRIHEKAGNFKFDVPKSVYYTCKNLNKINDDINIKNLNTWLKNLRVDNYLKNFILNGYHSIELLFLQMESQSPLTSEILKDEIGIDKIGHRSRIINKLKEDARSYVNHLKTTVLLVGNSKNSKFCDCIII